MLHHNATIFALASGAGKAGVAVIRVSGSESKRVLMVLTGKLPAPRQAALCKIRTPVGELIDVGLVFWFPGPASFSGEDCAEFHLHGSRAVINSMIKELSLIPGCRIAEPGEFTKRAFAHGKIDLAQAEGLADLIDSETEQQRRQALQQMSGQLGLLTKQWRADLLDALALTEAEIDFADEDDAASEVMPKVRQICSSVHSAIRDLLISSHASERIQEGLVVAIAGPPNVGKSSLLNRIAMREVAIVSDVAGTTRDLLSINLDVGGFPIQLVDTAGLRNTHAKVEQIGIERARAAMERADLVLWLEDGSRRSGGRSGAPIRTKTWIVRTKLDLPRSNMGRADFGLSAVSGQGIDALLRAIGDLASSTLACPASAIITKARHRNALADTVDALCRVLQMTPQMGLEVVAEELRVAMRRLGTVAGQIDVEELLGNIFSRFCIGK